MDQPNSLSSNLSHPGSRNAFGDTVDAKSVPDLHASGLWNGVESIEGLHSGAAPLSQVGVQNSTSVSHTFASAVGSSLSRSTTPEPQLVGRAAGSGLPPVGSSRVSSIEKKNVVGSAVQNGHSFGVTELADIAANLSGLNLSTAKHADEDGHLQSLLQLDIDNQPDFVFNMPNGHKQSLQQKLTDKSNAGKLSMTTNYIDFARKNGVVTNLNASKISSNGQVNFPKRTSSSASLYSEVNSSGFGSSEGSNFHQSTNIPSMDFSSHVTGAYPVNEKFNPAMINHLDAGPFLLFLLDVFHATFSSTQTFISLAFTV